MKKNFLFLLPLLLLTLLVACAPNLKKEKQQSLNYIDDFRETLKHDLNVSILFRDPVLDDLKYSYKSQEENISLHVLFIYPNQGYSLGYVTTGQEYHSKTKIYLHDASFEKYEESKMSTSDFRSNYYYELFNLNSLDFENAKYEQTTLPNENLLNTFTFDENTNLNINYSEYKFNLSNINVSFETSLDQSAVNLVFLKAYDSLTKNYIELLISNYRY